MGTQEIFFFDKLAKFERTNAILVEYIKSEQYLNVSQKNTTIHGTVWFLICVVKKWPFCSRCEQNRYFGRYLWWYGVVNSYKTHLLDVALILLYLLKNSHVCALNISVSINVVRWVFKSGHYTCTPFYPGYSYSWAKPGHSHAACTPHPQGLRLW